MKLSHSTNHIQNNASAASHSNSSSQSSPSSSITQPSASSNTQDYLGIFSHLPSSIRSVFLGQEVQLEVGAAEDDNLSKFNHGSRIYQDSRQFALSPMSSDSTSKSYDSDISLRSQDLHKTPQYSFDMNSYISLETKLENCLSELDMLRRELHSRDLEIDLLSNSCNPNYIEREKYWTGLLERVTKEHSQQKDAYITENAKLYNEIAKLKRGIKDLENTSICEEIEALKERLSLLAANLANKSEVIENLVTECASKDRLIRQLEIQSFENEDRIGRIFQNMDRSLFYIEMCSFAQEDIISTKARANEDKKFLQQSMTNYKAEIELKLNELRFQNTSLKGERNSWESKAKSLSRDLSKNLSGNDPLLKEVASLKGRLDQALAERKAFKEAMIAAYSMACRGSKPIKPEISSEILAELPPSLFQDSDGASTNSGSYHRQNTALNKLACIGGNSNVTEIVSKRGTKFTDLADHIDASSHRLNSTNSRRGGCFVAFDKRLTERDDNKGKNKSAGKGNQYSNDSD